MDCKQTHGYRLTDALANLWTQKCKNLKKTAISVCQCWSPRYRVSVLSTRCEGCHPKGLIVTSSYKIKQTITIITITRISTNKTFLGQFQLSLYLKKKKKNLIYFFPTRYSHQKSIKSIKFGPLAEFQHKF